MNSGRLGRSALIILFAGSIILAAFFFIRTIRFTLYWANPAHREQAIEGWMPLRYVARSWGVPTDVLTEALQITQGVRPRLTVAEIAVERGEHVGETTLLLNAAISKYRVAADE